MCSKFLGTISGISTINRGRAVSGFREQMQVRTQFACAPVMAAPKRESDAPLQQLVGGSCRLQAPTRRRANATEGKGAFELLPSARPTHALVLNRYPPPALPGERPLWRQRMARVGCPSTTVVGLKMPVVLLAVNVGYGTTELLAALEPVSRIQFSTRLFSGSITLCHG